MSRWSALNALFFLRLHMKDMRSPEESKDWSYLFKFKRSLKEG